MSNYVPKPSPDYHCPLCPDHEDDVFAWNAILKAPICDGCDRELWNDIVCEEKRPEGSFILDLLEQHTSLTFDEYRLIELEETIRRMSERPDADQAALKHYQAEVARLRTTMKSNSTKEVG